MSVLRNLYDISRSDFFSSVSLFVYVWGREPRGGGGGGIIESLFDYSQTGYRLRKSHHSIFNTKLNFLFASSSIFPLCRISQDLFYSLTTFRTPTMEKSVSSYRPKFKIFFSLVPRL